MTCLRCGAPQLGPYKYLCSLCAQKALEITASDPKERVEIYKIVIREAKNPAVKWAAEELMVAAMEEMEQMVLGTSDIFEERG